MAQQNGTVDVQRKNTGCTMIYIKGKKKYKQKTEEKKKKKWLTKMERQMNNEKRCMNSAKNTVEKRAQIDD